MLGTGVVGREGALAEVDAFLKEADDAFSALVLEGEPGIGKTTVWREALRRAEERGALVLSCRPSATEAKLSFAALADLLSPVEEATFAALPAPQRDALEVALLRTSPSGGAPSARAVAAGCLSLARDLARTRTVLLAVDDAQWLDPPSRAALEFTARRLEHETVGLLYSLRVPPAAAGIGGAVAEGRLHRRVLGALSLAAVGQIIAARLGTSLARPLLARINQASGGNPFYALEIVRLLIERGTASVVGAELPVPNELQELTATRIRRLRAESREALLLASVLATPDSRTIDIGALAAAEEAGIVTVGADGRVEFVHPLFASAAYGSVPRARRLELHRRAAELVSDPEERARHLALGSDSPDPGVAARLDEASALAALRGAPDAAAELGELAAQQTPSDDRDARGSRLVSAARFYFDTGDVVRSEALASQALELTAAKPVRAAALALSGQLAARRSSYIEAAEVSSAALELAGVDHRLRASIELDLVYCTISVGDLAGAQSHARAAVEHAELAGEDGMTADALAVLTLADFLGGEGLAEERLVRALALEEPLMSRLFIMRPRVIHGLLQLWLGEVDGALNTLTIVRDDAVNRGQEWAGPMVSFYLVWAALWRGDLPLAARLSEGSRTALALLDDPTLSAITLAGEALVHAHDGHAELARAEAVESLALFERLQSRTQTIWPLWALGLAELSEGDPARADQVLGPLAEQLSAMGPGDPVLAMFMPDEVEALIALGELDRAQAYLAPFEQRSRELDRAWALAAAARCRGALATARGEPEHAFAAFDEALAAHDRCQMPFERARTLLVAGQCYRRFKQRRRARTALTEALALFERFGAPSWAARTQRGLARVGRPAGAADGLTDTELRLAELAASGLSNREVADRAFVAVKTVEANLTRVYRKLGIRSRASLADALRAYQDTQT